jgi:hypothetical protein
MAGLPDVASGCRGSTFFCGAKEIIRCHFFRCAALMAIKPGAVAGLPRMGRFPAGLLRCPSFAAELPLYLAFSDRGSAP